MPTRHAHVRAIRTSEELDAEWVAAGRDAARPGPGLAGHRGGRGSTCRPPDPPGLPRVELSSGVEVIEVQQRVEHQEVAAFGLAAPDRVVREDDDVPLLERDVDDGGVLRDLAAVLA